MTSTGGQGQSTEVEQVYRAIHTLYSQDLTIPYADKQAASTWLNEFQRSVSIKASLAI